MWLLGAEVPNDSGQDNPRVTDTPPAAAPFPDRRCDDPSGPPGNLARYPGERALPTRELQVEDMPTACDCAALRENWPDSLPPKYEPSGFKEAFGNALAAAAPDVPFEIDCDEFPCIGIITERRLSHEERAVMREKLLDHSYVGAEKKWIRHNAAGALGHAQLEAVAMYPPESDTEDLRAALDRRIAVWRERTRESVSSPREE